jgi:restriction endonuclease S subunit
MKWVERSLVDVLVEARNGTWGSSPKGDDTDLPVLRSTNIHDANLVLADIALRSISERSASKYQLRDGDIIVTTSSGSKHLIGKNALFQQPNDGQRYLFSNFTLCLRPRQDVIIPRYLHLYLNSSKAKAELLRIQSTTSGLRNLNVSLYLAQPVPLPALSEQRRIVEILDQADALRKKRAEADAKAARILPALFYKMFGDPAMNPKGWPTKLLGEVTIGNPQYGANASAAEWTEGSPRYVRITDITDDGRLLKTGVVTLNLDNWAPYQLTTGDLLFARSGNTVGKTYLYQPQDGLCAYAGYLIRFKADQNQVLPWYLFALTQTGYYKSWVEARKRVAGQPNINGKEYASLQIPCPPIPIQEAFIERIERLIDLRDKRNTTEKKIKQLFGVLLHRAFTGDLTAKWREAHMKELLQEMELQAKALETTNYTKSTKGKNS